MNLNVDQQDCRGRTKLYKAAKDGDLSTCIRLFNQGADLDIRNIDGDTALTRSAYYGHTDVVKFLCNNGAQAEMEGNLNKEVRSQSLPKSVVKASPLLDTLKACPMK